MIHTNYTIRFVLHHRSDSPHQYVQMRVTPRGNKPVSFATGLSLAPSEWDPILGRAKGRTAQAAEVNSLIAQWSQVVANIFLHYEKLTIIPTADQLRQAFARATADDLTAPEYSPQPTTSVSTLAAYTQFITDRRAEWSQGTVDTLIYFRKIVAEFFKDMPLNMVDANVLMRFHLFLIDERNQQGVTVHSNITRFKWFLKWARQKGIYSGNADNEYRPKIKGSKDRNRAIIFLTQDELRQVEQYTFSEHHKNVSKDVFLFCCYTGLRSSDILRLSQADIHGDHITFTTQKTNDTLTIPLNTHARAILDRYQGCTPNRRQRTLGILQPALPTPDRKTQNKALHTIMKEIGIDAPTHHIYYIGANRHDEIVPKYELISTHTARHTFIVTAISLGISPTIISSWTGHKNYDSMKSYIAIANETSIQAMQRFNTL